MNGIVRVVRRMDATSASSTESIVFLRVRNIEEDCEKEVPKRFSKDSTLAKQKDNSPSNICINAA